MLLPYTLLEYLVMTQVALLRRQLTPLRTGYLCHLRQVYRQGFGRPPQSPLHQAVFIQRVVEKYVPDLLVVLLLKDFQGHIVVVVIDGLIDLVIDYNLIFSFSQVQEDTPLVPAFRLANEVLAVLHGSKQNPQP